MPIELDRRRDHPNTGKEEDVEVGLSYFGKRFLSPALGRWVSADPLGVHVPGEADLNLYAYVHGAVLKATDPLGLEPSEPAKAAAGVVTGTGEALGGTAPAGMTTDRTFQFFRGAGKVATGVAQVYAGIAGLFAGSQAAGAGAVGSGASGGAAAPVAMAGIGVMVASGALALNGAASIGQGLGTMADSTSLSSGGSPPVDPASAATTPPPAGGSSIPAGPAPPAAPRMNGNSKASNKPQHAYEVKEVNPTTGEKIDTFKFGVSGRPLRLDGQSPRAEQQVRQLNKDNPGRKFESEVVGQVAASKKNSGEAPAREAILNVEKTLVKQYKDAHPLNQQPKGNILPKVK